LLKSVDSSYHVQIIKYSRGNNTRKAKELAGQVDFQVHQSDSILYLPDAFAITRGQHFRNQQVLVAVAIPVGKRILVNRNIERYRWFSINTKNSHIRWNKNWKNNWNDDWDDDNDNWINSYSWTNNVEYVMTDNGLVRTDKKHTVSSSDDDEDSNPKERAEEPKKEQPGTEKQGTENGGGYRYHRSTEPAKPKANKDTAMTKSTAMQSFISETHLYLLSVLYN
jgi:hypothetical protein